MMKVKLFIAGLVFGALLLAMAVSEARVASEKENFSQDSFLPSIETVSESVQSNQSIDVSTDSSATIDINSSTSAESTTTDSSSSVNVNMSVESDGTTNEPQVDIKVNGQNIPCGPDRYRSDNVTVDCQVNIND